MAQIRKALLQAYLSLGRLGDEREEGNLDTEDYIDGLENILNVLFEALLNDKEMDGI